MQGGVVAVANLRGGGEFGDEWHNQGRLTNKQNVFDDFAASINYLIDKNWDLKELIRLIVRSSTFKQSSLISGKKRLADPDMSFYSYFKRRRLTGEAIRDQALAVSGLLVSKNGGKPVYPYQPKNLWYEATASTSDTKHYVQSIGEANYRRSIYTFWKRNFPPPFLTIFDAPTRHYTQSKRNSSNSPLQALALLNDPQITETYNALAKKIPENLRANF